MHRRAAQYGLFVLTVLNLLNYVDRFILAAVLPRIQSELSLTNTEAGLLATAFLIAYFITSPAFGVLGDRFSRTRLMSAGVGAWSLATAATGLMSNFAQLMAARSFVGIGEAAYASISPSLLSDYFPPAQRGRAFAVFYTAIPVGAAAGYLLGGSIEAALGWRSAFFIVGAPGLAAALLTLTIADPQRGANKTPTDVVPSVLSALRAFGRNRAYVGAVLGYAAYTFALGGLAYWMPAYLAQVRGLNLAQANYITGGVTAAAGVGGTFLGGYLGDSLSLRIRHGQLWVSGLSSIAAIAPAWLALTVHSNKTYLVWFFVAEFLLFLSTSPVNVVIVSVVPAGARALAMALSIFTIHLLGDAISPAIIGALADFAGLSRAVLIVPAAIAVSGLLWVLTAAKTEIDPTLPNGS